MKRKSESIYCDARGRISNLLNRLQHETLLYVVPQSWWCIIQRIYTVYKDRLFHSVCCSKGMHQSHLVRFETLPLMQHLPHRHLCMPKTRLVLATDLRGLRWNASRTLSVSSDTRGWPGLMPSHKHPVSTNCRYRLVTLFLWGASVLNRTRNSSCTVITDRDTSTRSIQKALHCCDSLLKTVVPLHRIMLMQQNTNSVAWDRERPPPVGEVSNNFCA
jgi:uncharacterized protein (UPF0248 family)